MPPEISIVRAEPAASTTMSPAPSPLLSPSIVRSLEIDSVPPVRVTVPDRPEANTMSSAPDAASARAIASRKVVWPSSAVRSDRVVTVNVAIGNPRVLDERTSWPCHDAVRRQP